MSIEALTLYTAKICPFAQRAEIALALASVDYKRYEIDLQNKPEWYALKVNPVSKVPAVAYGGPDVSPDQPSPESTKIVESLVIVEFIADLFPNAGIFPSDPVQRAQARFFVDQASVKYVDKFVGHLHKGTPASELLAGAEALQALLPADKKFALGDELTAGDIALAPFLIRSEVVFAHIRDDDGVWKAFQAGKYARLWKYYQDLKAHPAIASTFDVDYLIAAYKQRFSDLNK